MLEVEMKFHVDDLKALADRLAQSSVEEPTVRRDSDQYFNAPDRDFAQTDEALRIRRTGDGNFVTYKGPKRDALTKTRTEIEVPLGDGDAAAEGFAQILVKLGYRPVAIVRKTRRVLHLERGGFQVQVCLDEVDGLGHFAELEIVAPEDRFEAARAVLLDLASELGLTRSERRSYLQLLLEKSGGRPS
jgi:adenylate cyclase class 2